MRSMKRSTHRRLITGSDRDDALVREQPVEPVSVHFSDVFSSLVVVQSAIVLPFGVIA